jgi:hypothetical protein
MIDTNTAPRAEISITAFHAVACCACVLAVGVAIGLAPLTMLLTLRGGIFKAASACPVSYQANPSYLLI